MNSLKASVLGALITSCAHAYGNPSFLYNGKLYGNGCSRLRPHSRRYKTGSHKQVLRKQGKL